MGEVQFSMSDALPKMITPTPADHAAIRYINGRNAANSAIAKMPTA
jgi:hypothetical protein